MVSKSQPTPIPKATHWHVLPTPLCAKDRWVAREIKRKLIREQLKGKLPTEIADSPFVLRGCAGKCMDDEEA